MQYQFDNPPTTGAIIAEFGINPERFHTIKCHLQTAAEQGREFEHWADTWPPEQLAGILRQAGLLEAFALLCSLPGCGGGCLYLCNPAGSEIPDVEVSACFDGRGMLESMKGDRWCLLDHAPWEFHTGRTPESIAADDALMGEWREMAEECLGWGVDEEPGIVALSTFRHSEQQWRRRFVAERWYRNDLKPAERFVDPELAGIWERIVASHNRFPEALARFLKWAEGRKTWGERMPRF